MPGGVGGRRGQLRLLHDSKYGKPSYLWGRNTGEKPWFLARTLEDQDGFLVSGERRRPFNLFPTKGGDRDATFEKVIFANLQRD